MIVCEGEKTEVNYLNKLIVDLDLPNSVYVRVAGESDPTPDKVIEFAIKWLEEEAREAEFGQYQTTVFCVIDRDEHSTFDAAVKRLKDISQSTRYNKQKYKKKPLIKSIKSYPCFEVWYLFHFIKTSRPYVKQGGNSPCKCLIKELSKQPGFNNYEKADSDHYYDLKPMMPTAVINATFAQGEAGKTGNPNPSTETHELIDYLKNIKTRIEFEKAQCKL